MEAARHIEGMHGVAAVNFQVMHANEAAFAMSTRGAAAPEQGVEYASAEALQWAAAEGGAPRGAPSRRRRGSGTSPVRGRSGVRSIVGR